MILENWVKIANIASPIIALLGLGGIILQLRSNATQARRERAYQMSDLYSREMSKLAYEMRKFFTSPTPLPSEKWRIISSPITPQEEELRLKVLDFFGYFEDLGAMWNLGRVDHIVIKRLLKPVIVRTYDYSKWYIEQWRKDTETGRPTTYKEWTDMVEAMQIPPIYNFREWWEYYANGLSE